MRPELFTIPLINISVKSYGAMMVLGFLAALWLARRRSRKLRENPQTITNFAVYTLIAGVIGARIMHVLHNWSHYRYHPKEIPAIWQGGLEFLGGVILAIVVMLIYFKRKKLPILNYLDILAPATMLGLTFGRLGCFLNGCCFGAPSELPWAIRFPPVNTMTQLGPGCQKASYYRYSFPYDYQLRPDPGRPAVGTPLILLPDNFYEPGYWNAFQPGHWVATLDFVPEEEQHAYYRQAKPPWQLTENQLRQLQEGRHPMHPIHPSQLYSALNALLLAAVLNRLFRRRRYDGFIIAWMFVLYGATRFLLEMTRVEPKGLFGFTISQNMSLVSIGLGAALLILLPLYHRPPAALKRAG